MTDHQRGDVLAYQRGDAAAGGRLLLANEGLLCRLAGRYLRLYTGKGLDLDDVLQEARAGFLIGAQRFDFGYTVRVPTYCLHWARARVSDHMQRYKRRNDLVWLDDDDRDDAPPDWVPRELHSTATAETALDSERTRRRVQAAVATLGPRERAIITRRWLGEEATLQDIGEDWGLSRERVRQLEVRAFDALRRRLAA